MSSSTAYMEYGIQYFDKNLRIAEPGMDARIKCVFEPNMMEIGLAVWRDMTYHTNDTQTLAKEAYAIHAAVGIVWNVRVLQALMLIMNWRRVLQAQEQPWPWQKLMATLQRA